ncbi:CRISPR-associated endonuclease Cas2 [Methylocaldum sp. 14B]|jgi:CRISPR-associated protein Cas2|uniref:CRISPR-associated endonuclease Cas2 n=1 Tax=Methylocaldum sp. 14B TaxID=1912213 RepID=UPI00098A71D4|nr:CRISPR-associated endonuclease Cas2 [Methylocaldum sp. 14B]
MSFYLVCYDIADERIRERAADILLRYGERVQESVYEVWLRDGRTLAELRDELSEVLGEERQLRFYRLCGRCRRDSESLDGLPVASLPAAIIL